MGRLVIIRRFFCYEQSLIIYVIPEVISTLVDWNYLPAFCAGIPTSIPGHLAMPSSQESNTEFDVQMLDTEINSPESVNEGSPSHLLVHEKAIMQAEKDLDNALVENTEILADQTMLSIQEPAPVKDPEPPLSSQMLIVDPSSLHISSSGIAGHGGDVKAEEVAQDQKNYRDYLGRCHYGGRKRISTCPTKSRGQC